MNNKHEEKTESYSSVHNSSITDIGAKFDADYALGSQHSLRMGVRSVIHSFLPSASVTKGSVDYQNTSSSNRINSLENNLYIEDDWRIGQSITLNAGVRASSFTTQKTTYFNAEPRLSGKVMLAPELALKASYSRMNQYTHLLSATGVGLPTDLWIPSTKNIRPQRSDQYALGLAKDFSEDKLTLSVEGYYKKMSHMVSYKEGATYLDLDYADNDISKNDNGRLNWEDNITVGKGKSYGVEMLLQRKSGKLSGWIGYTLSWTKFQFDDINEGKEYYPKQDRRHDLSLVGIYEVSPKIKLSFSWVYSSRASMIIPVAVYDLNKHIPSETVPSTQNGVEYSPKGTFRAEAYHRLDIAAQFIKKKKYGERTWEIGFYNAYNHINPFYYGESKNNTLVKYGFPVIPSVSYSYKF
jgi:outer membrane receptor protein involved in Fe transport